MFISHAGMLLVATPRLLDPYFFRTVVLLIQHDPDGTIGLVLNRETSAEVVDHLPGWAPLAIAPGRIHYGGPVEPEVAIGLSLTSAGMATGVSGLNLIDLADDPPDGGSGVRVYSGYSGWGTGQLEDELSSGSWFLVPAAPDDPFAAPEYQWRDVLRRQSGLLSVVSTYPDDPSLN